VRLTAAKCVYTPHILDISSGRNSTESDGLAMPDGYIVFIVMTKVPGESLTCDKYWGYTPEKRE
jgi:hypothetical protein